MPGELKRLLAGEVRRTGQSLNDVAVGILASRFAVTFEPSGRLGKEPGKSGSVLLRMPAELTAAFDVTTDKVGKNLAEAIWAHPNNTIKFADVPKTGITVHRGMTHDGLGKYVSEIVTKAPGETDDVTGILKETGTDVVVNYLPVGSEEATKWYTEQILNAGCAMANCMPVFIRRETYWSDRFKKS